MSNSNVPPASAVVALWPGPQAEGSGRGGEAAMAAALSRGDREAQRSFYRQHAARVAQVVRRLGIGPEDVEDLVQTTFLEALRGAARFRGQSSLRAWVLGIALNQARNFIRARVQARRGEVLMRCGTSEPPPSAERALGERQELERLERALARLPELQREALVLCELSELPGREVAALLGAPPGTVWRRVHEARQALKRLLEAPSGAEDG